MCFFLIVGGVFVGNFCFFWEGNLTPIFHILGQIPLNTNFDKVLPI